jgi:hypothetical protein
LHLKRDFVNDDTLIASISLGERMSFPAAGLPPASVSDYIEDMLNELAELADRLGDGALAAAIRQAGLVAAHANAKARA